LYPGQRDLQEGEEAQGRCRSPGVLESQGSTAGSWCCAEASGSLQRVSSHSPDQALPAPAAAPGTPRL